MVTAKENIFQFLTEGDGTNSDFKTELTLERLSVIAVASHLWEFPKIKQIVKKHLNNYWDKIVDNGETLDAMSEAISKTVLQMLNHNLPEALKIEVQNKVSEMIQELHDWIKYLNHYSDVKFVGNIYWTSNGLIDEDRIFKYFWRDFSVKKRIFRKEGWFYKKFKPFHVFACLFAQEELIMKFQADIVKEIKSVLPSFRIDDNSDVSLNIMNAVLPCFKKLEGSFSWDLLPTLTTMNHSPTEILGICSGYGLYKAFVYFYNHLDQTEEYNYLEEVSKTCLLGYDGHLEIKAEHGFQIALFLLDKMNASQKDSFILKNFGLIFSMSLRKESYQKYCLPLLNNFLSRYTINDSLGKTITLFKQFVNDMIRVLLQSYQDCPLHIQILATLLKGIPKEHKENMYFNMNHPFLIRDPYSIMSKIFQIFYIPALRLIINDEDVKHRKYDMVKLGERNFKDLIKQKDFKLLNQFMDAVLISEQERKKFKQDFNFLEEWIESHSFDTVDGVLQWMHGDEADARKIELKNLCFSLVRKDYYHSIKPLLKWYFGSQEEPFINSFKGESEHANDFCRELIYHVWFRSDSIQFKQKRLNIKISTAIITSVFGAEEEKRNMLVKDESCVRFYCENLLKLKNLGKRDASFDYIDQFFKFCSLPTKKIDCIKKSIADNISDWIEKYGASVHRFEITAALLHWIYGNNFDNYEKLKNHFPDLNAVTLYYTRSWNLKTGKQSG